ncbi:CPBP family intramembrane glutamic endopeptidase [Halolamina salifodinae]|uniref:Membrane protease YdiL (CAAX protease family) n=2 Tax=Halolamina salifodinae TaxID=1202767 RepID=A0A8T4H001_9EURY|nr:type II CAAX endopeptidase family protein [Halolamina salifodinae]MBP1987882.1 membrane protease YdiL (CAAX protease family) [Halolamina salifodinae]
MDSRLRAAGVGLGVGVAGFIGGNVIALLIALSLSAAGVDITPVLNIVVSLLFLTGVGFMGTAVAYLRYRGIPLRSLGIKVPSIKEFGLVIGALVASMVYLMVLGSLLQATGTESANNQIADLAVQNPEIVLYLLPGAYLLIGPGEELLFRGVVQNRIRESFGAKSGVFIASVVFAAIHVTSLVGTDASAVLVSLIGLMGPSLLLGGLYEYTRNLVVPILVHGTYDALIFLALYAVATGTVEESGNAAAAIVAVLP